MRLWWVVLFSVVTAVGAILLWKYSWETAQGDQSPYFLDDEDTLDPYPAALLVGSPRPPGETE